MASTAELEMELHKLSDKISKLNSKVDNLYDLISAGKMGRYIHEDVVAKMVDSGIITYEAWKEINYDK
jgi:hypothetical protein